MDGFELFKQGAEAKLYKGTYLGKSVIVKERFPKKYRHEDLDTSLTRERMKAECRAIVRCKSAGILTPTIYLVDAKTRSIYMEYFDRSVTIKEFILKANKDIIEELSNKIGERLARMHSNDIIHGDLTTSNMLIVNKNESGTFDSLSDVKIAFIDFGLAHIDTSAEDKGVDLYVLERALLSTHVVAKEMFSTILNAYKQHYPGCKEILLKYEDVRARGRKRTMVG